MKRTRKVGLWAFGGGSLAVALLTAGAGCEGGPASGGAVGQSNAALHAPAPSIDANVILGFESTDGWSVNGDRDDHDGNDDDRGRGHGSLATTIARTQGTAALALTAPSHDVLLASARVASTGAALAGLGDPGSSFAVDVALPADLGDPDDASLELSVSCRSRHLDEAHLGRATFRGARPDSYQTLKFAIDDRVRTALGGATFDDLEFRLRVHSPGHRPAGAFRFDNLRVHSPSTPPAGAGQPLDLTALLSYAPAANTPGQASFPVGVVQVPQSLHVKLGSAGNGGSATLDLGFGGTPSITCTFAAAQGGTAYDLASCTGGHQAGDLVGADFARLTVVAGDPAAGSTKVRAQLALNPVGDQAGAGVIPPLPTFWGTTAASTSQILDAYTAALTAKPATEHVWVTTPTPDSARRTSDFSPVDTTNGPPPPNDPPFHKAGHANPGGDFDAYWALDGGLSTSSSGGHNTAHFDADASMHAVLFGGDSTIAEVKVAADTDTGVVQQNGFQSPSATGSLHMYLFGQEIPGGGDVDPSIGFKADLSTGEQTFNLPPITFWVFSITVGVQANAGVLAQGTLSPVGVSVNVTPHASFGAHLEGDIGVPGIIEGGVDVSVDLLTVNIPFNADANWTISTDPTKCNATVNFAASGKITVSSGGGEVDLEASFGPCPLCVSVKQKLFSWDPLYSNTFTVFTIDASAQAFALPSNLCDVTLTVDANAPNGGGPVIATESAQLSASGIRPATTNQPPTILDCADFTWTGSDNPDDAGLFPVKGCNPFVKFPTKGPRTLTVQATDQYGETGQATVSFTVDPGPTQLTALILTPVDGATIFLNGPDPTIYLKGDYAAGDANTSLIWKITAPDGTQFLIVGATGSYPVDQLGTYTVQLYAADNGNEAIATVHIVTQYLI